MNSKIIGGIVAVIAVIAIIAIFALQQDDKSNPIPIVVQSNKKLGLVINSQNTQIATKKDLQELKQVYEQAASTGIGRSNVYLFWDSIEPEKGEFNWENSDILMSFNKQNDLQVTLFFSIVNGRGLGPFPDWMGRQALTENLAENTVRVVDIILTRYDIIDTVILGAEIDAHFRYNEGGVLNYQHFFNIVYDELKEKHPDVKLGNTFALHSVYNKNLVSLLDELNLGDFIGFSYAPVNTLNDITKTPNDARADLDTIFDHITDKKIGIFEISWSTSDFVGGNNQDQIEFLKTAYDFYHDNESKIEFFTWYRYYDRPNGTCDPSEDSVSLKPGEASIGGASSGIGSSEFVIERLGHYICNTGLIDINGNPKPSWNEFKLQVQQ